MTYQPAFPPRFKPMKGELADLTRVQFPCYVSPKIDGFRMVLDANGKAHTSSLRPVDNVHVREFFNNIDLPQSRFLDGEIVVGEPNDPKVYSKSTGPLRRFDGQPDFIFWVFDKIDVTQSLTFADRFIQAEVAVSIIGNSRIRMITHTYCESMEELMEQIVHNAVQGFEGSMIRSPHGPYKFGRSTLREGYLLKHKDFADYEARIESVEEEVDILFKQGKGQAGKFMCTGLNGPYKDMKFPVSLSSMTHEQRKHAWRCKDDAETKGTIITYKCLAHASGYTLPRGAQWKAFRPSWDMSND